MSRNFTHKQHPSRFRTGHVQTDKDRFSEYPKLRDLVAAKDEQVKRFATPPMFLKVSLSLSSRKLACFTCRSSDWDCKLDCWAAHLVCTDVGAQEICQNSREFCTAEAW